MTKKLTIGLSLLAFAAACGGSKSNQLSSPSASSVDTSSTSTPSTPSVDTSSGPSAPDVIPAEVPGTAGLYVRGVDSSLYSAVGLKVIGVTVDGVALDKAGNQWDDIDLAQDVSWRIGTIASPTSDIQVVVTFAKTGTSSNGDVVNDALPVDFTGLASQIALQNHAVVHIDVNASFLPWGSSITFLPQYGIHY